MFAWTGFDLEHRYCIEYVSMYRDTHTYIPPTHQEYQVELNHGIGADVDDFTRFHARRVCI